MSSAVELNKLYEICITTNVLPRQVICFFYEVSETLRVIEHLQVGC